MIIFLTNYIPAAVPLSICCEESSTQRALNLFSYYMEHSTLAVTTLNLIAVQKFTAVTQQTTTVELTKALLLLKIACLKYCALCKLSVKFKFTLCLKLENLH
jgi:hypothetical protein